MVDSPRRDMSFLLEELEKQQTRIYRDALRKVQHENKTWLARQTTEKILLSSLILHLFQERKNRAKQFYNLINARCMHKSTICIVVVFPLLLFAAKDDKDVN